MRVFGTDLLPEGGSQNIGIRVVFCVPIHNQVLKMGDFSSSSPAWDYVVTERSGKQVDSRLEFEPKTTGTTGQGLRPVR
jgi:hypothetical protein